MQKPCFSYVVNYFFPGVIIQTFKKKYCLLQKFNIKPWFIEHSTVKLRVSLSGNNKIALR